MQRTIHAHPTLAEALHEAALAADTARDRQHQSLIPRPGNNRKYRQAETPVTPVTLRAPARVPRSTRSACAP